MSSMAVVHLVRPLKAVKIVTDYLGKDGAAPSGTVHQPVHSEHMTSTEAIPTQQQLYQDTVAALQEVVVRLNQLYDDVFSGHHEAIARLSIEIARKVLMRNISDGDYELESIIKEALKSVPEGSGRVVRLNPEDLADFRKLQNADPATLSGIELAADAAIGRAECVIESSKGVIKLLIDEHLEQISKALVKTG